MSSLTEPVPILAEATLAPLFDGYRPLHDHYDEMKGEDGQIRPHWRRLVEALRRLSPAEMDARWQRVERILYELKAFFNFFILMSYIVVDVETDGPIP